MLGPILIVVGSVAMIFGVLMLWQWTGVMRRWFDPAIYDPRGETKNERQYLDLYFIAMVIAPLLGGAVMIVLGLREVL